MEDGPPKPDPSPVLRGIRSLPRDSERKGVWWSSIFACGLYPVEWCRSLCVLNSKLSVNSFWFCAFGTLLSVVILEIFVDYLVPVDEPVLEPNEHKGQRCHSEKLNVFLFSVWCTHLCVPLLSCSAKLCGDVIVYESTYRT